MGLKRDDGSSPWGGEETLCDPLVWSRGALLSMVASNRVCGGAGSWRIECALTRVHIQAADLVQKSDQHDLVRE